jgi:hypothetical protein
VIAGHIHDALAQVRRLQELLLNRGLFEGYSGKARMLSGGAALAAAAVMSLPAYPESPRAHLAGWLAVLAVAGALNYGALAWWWWSSPRVRARPALLKPALDALPALIAGGALSLALVRAGAFDTLAGTWMSLFGLAHLAYKQTLPGENYLVGLGYVAAGIGCLLWPGLVFTNPWPMGLVFFAGETAGGMVLILRRHRAEFEHGGDEAREHRTES